MPRTLLATIALVLVGCSPPPSSTSDESDQTAQAASAEASAEETAPAEEPPPAEGPARADTGASNATQASTEPFNEVPAKATALITQSAIHHGNFGLTGIARVCGEVPKEASFAATPTFIVQFYPDNGPPAKGLGEVTDVTFNTTELVGGATSAATFFLSLTVQSTDIGSPYALVLDTSQPKIAGHAKLTTPGPGLLQLVVDGTNDRGEDVHLVLDCGPK